jgi:hypothetical protein
MNIRQLFFVGASILASTAGGVTQERQEQYVQTAEIEIDPSQLDAYKAAVSEHAETAIREEPGVLVCMPYLKKITPQVSGCSKFTPTPRRTGRT